MIDFVNFLFPFDISSNQELKRSDWWGLPECIFSVTPIISYDFNFVNGNDYYWISQVFSFAQEYRDLGLSTQGEDVTNNWLLIKRKKAIDRLDDAFFRHDQLWNTEFSILYQTPFDSREWIK